MRIGLNTPDPQEVTNQKPAAPSASPKNVPQAPENGEVSLHDSVALSALASQALQMPEVRQDKVDSLRQSIVSGQYQLDAKASAEGMLSQWQEYT
jgi:flagellar biosynthesis anti-sigma factor FlgM